MVEEFEHTLSDLTGFQRDLLFALAWFEKAEGKDSVHGLELRDLLNEQYDKDIHHSKLYPNLDTLVSKGLVIKQGSGGSGANYKLAIRGENSLENRYESLSFVEE